MVTDEDILIIKGLFNKGYSVADIAIKMGLDPQEVVLVTKDLKREVKTS